MHWGPCRTESGLLHHPKPYNGPLLLHATKGHPIHGSALDGGPFAEGVRTICIMLPYRAVTGECYPTLHLYIRRALSSHHHWQALAANSLRGLQSSGGAIVLVAGL